jgi:hypothetical protein
MLYQKRRVRYAEPEGDKMTFLSIIRDQRINCHSALTSLPVSDFLGLVEGVYGKRGGIEGQRAPLKTKTGLSIRARMVSDLEAGAVIPPVVVGVHGTKDDVSALIRADTGEKLLASLRDVESDRISIIDGMQRTTALLEAIKNRPEIGSESLRVEFWIADNLNSLIYRMLVLNTGQVPWEIGRQLETVYSQLLYIIRSEVGSQAEIFSRDDARRRSEPGQFQASSVIRLFLAFSSRRAEFDLKDKVAEDFARLDAIEASSHSDFLGLFIRTLQLVVELDRVFSRAPHAPRNEKDVRIADGNELFQSFPALVGFFVAASIKLFDEPGFEVDWGGATQRMDEVEGSLWTLIRKLEASSPEEVEEFLQLSILNARLAQRSGQVGRFERDLFVRAFRSMIDNAARLKDMTPCWRA